MLKILVCGDRNWTDKAAIHNILKEYPEDSILIEGAARGADRLAGEVANELGWEVVEIAADWTAYGPRAGPIRNQEMLDLSPDIVIGFHNDIESSKGTKHMLTIAKAAGKEVRLYKGTSE